MMPSDNDRQRGSVLGLQIIDKTSGKRLGTVTELWLDVDRKSVMGFTVSDRVLPISNISFGDQFYLPLERVDLLGPDALLVEGDRLLEDILTAERYTALVGCEVVTEAGEPLGKVRDFKFEPRSGQLSALILAQLPSPLIPDSLISTYEMDIYEIVAVGRDRIIVTEGMEARLVQLTKGLLERVGLGKPAWEQDYDDEYYAPPTSSYTSGNALGAGSRGSYNPGYGAPTGRPLHRREELREELRAERETWEEEDNWGEERVPPARRQARMEPPERSQPSRRVEPRTEDLGDEPGRGGYLEGQKREIRSAWSAEEPSRVPEEELEDL
ncbi:MAG TPA: PRC-barrel domain protein [Cyanobacteria bacterium UBA8156]|jgi:sporulation protein YlmC with PRC-barrel domain|nr:PRC-barrel domain protein [Cyanobacteria bacterium UBA8156]